MFLSRLHNMLLPFLVLVAFTAECAAQSHTQCFDEIEHPSCNLLPLRKDCGRAFIPLKPQPPGHEARVGEFPWVALLIYRVVFEVACSATIISDRYLLSAAHCCPGVGRELLYARVGEHDYSTGTTFAEDGNPAPPAYNVAVEKCIIHEEFRLRDSYNNICLIRLKEPLLFTEFVSPVCLPLSVKYNTFHIANIQNQAVINVNWAGFLKPYSNQTLINSSILQKLNLRVVNFGLCRDHFSSTYVAISQENNLCAQSLEDGRDPCINNLGGGLIRRYVNYGDRKYSEPRYYIYGIPIALYIPCEENLLSVNMNVNNYIRWILDHIEP